MYQLLSGLIFYDVKKNLLYDALDRTRSYLRRPFVTLNRHQDKLREECLFLQGYQQLHHIDPARLRQNERAFEVSEVFCCGCMVEDMLTYVIVQIFPSFTPHTLVYSPLSLSITSLL